MLKALVWKEFREVLPICATTIAAQLILFSYAVNAWRIHRPQDAYGAWPLLYIVTLLLSVAVGIWQNVRDENQGTFQFVLHRPVTRSTVFTVRLLLGAAICLIIGLMPLLLFTLWVEVINLHHREGVGSETIGALCSGIWLLYTGAFLSVLRPARWYGSRFLPLFAGILLYVLIQFCLSWAQSMLSEYANPMPEVLAWHMCLTATAVFLGPLTSLGFAIAALYVAEMRDYA